ncbi:MAG: caspase family protein, partial [Sciscionella sp.]
MALVIATYEHHDAGLRRLTSPSQDAESLAAVLQEPDIAGFEVRTMINEPHYRVGEAIGEFYRDRRSEDLTLLYFTGHGLKDDTGQLFLTMTDTRRDNLLFSALSAQQIDAAMDGCVSRRKVLILDCCYGGAFPAEQGPKADVAVHTLERFQGRGRVVLTASDATQYSFEGNHLHGQPPGQAPGDAAPSVFTRHLVAGLREGTADLDGDGDITLDELYSYVYDRVVADMPQQRPKKQANVEGSIIIARNVNWTLPTYLHNAVTSPLATERLATLDELHRLYRIGNPTVRSRVHEEIQRLADDDSKQVSTAATARLPLLTPAPPPPVALPANPYPVPLVHNTAQHEPKPVTPDP